MAKRTMTDTIPKLDRIQYLFNTLGGVRDGLSFDEIREDLLSAQKDSITRKKRILPDSLWTNTRDALRELMKLGMIRPAALPSKTQHFHLHKGRKFELTPEGSSFLELESADVWEFRDRFAQAMLLAHPHLQVLVRVLSQGELFFPRLARPELPGSFELWREGVPEPLEQVGTWLACETHKATGTELSPARLENKMRPHLTAAWARMDWGNKPNAITKKIIKTFNDVSIRALLHNRELAIDCVTFRSAVALLSDLRVLWETHSVPGRRGWTVWKTSETEIPQLSGEQLPAAQALEGPLWFTRLTRPEEDIRDALVEEFLSSSDRRGGFALIHALRAKVCHRLQIHGRDFDAVLRKMHERTLEHPDFIINLDRGSASEVPPSEHPFEIKGRAFYLITLLKRELMERN